MFYLLCPSEVSGLSGEVCCLDAADEPRGAPNGRPYHAGAADLSERQLKPTPLLTTPIQKYELWLVLGQKAGVVV